MKFQYLSVISMVTALLTITVITGCQKQEEVTPAPVVRAVPVPIPVVAPAPVVAKAPVPVPEKAVMPIESTVFFDTDKVNIDDVDQAVLDFHATWLTADISAKITIEGNCDERGTNKYNLALGQRRSDSVRDYLVSKGVAADRIETISFGEERPTCTDSRESCWVQNRNASIVAR